MKYSLTMSHLEQHCLGPVIHIEEKVRCKPDNLMCGCDGKSSKQYEIGFAVEATNIVDLSKAILYFKQILENTYIPTQITRGLYEILSR